MPAGRCEPRDAAAEAEADGEDRTRGGAKVLDRSRHVQLHGLGPRLLHVRPELEIVATRLGAGGAPEVIEGDGRRAAFGEPERQLLVEAVQPADVGEDHHADAVRLVGRRLEGGEAIPVGGLERQPVVRDGGAADDGNRRPRVGTVAHEISA